MNQKLAFEGKRNKLEDALIEGTIDREAFKRKNIELQNQIRHMEIQLQEVNNKCRIDINLIDDTLAFTRDIYATYKDAPPFMKRHYLRFFYEKVMIKNKKIFVTVPTPIFATLRDNQQVIQKTPWLEKWVQFRTTDWTMELEYPEYTAKEVGRFLSYPG